MAFEDGTFGDSSRDFGVPEKPSSINRTVDTDQDAKYYNEVCDDAQQGLIRAMEKLEKARIHLVEKGFDIAADKAAGTIGSIKAAANEIDDLPALGDN